MIYWYTSLFISCAVSHHLREAERLADAGLLLELKGVSKTYDAGADRTETPVLRYVNLQLLRGESVAIVGPSGSGKSTLLNIIGTLDRPSSGTVTLDGQDLSTLGERELARIRSREIGLIF